MNETYICCNQTIYSRCLILEIYLPPICLIDLLLWEQTGRIICLRKVDCADDISDNSPFTNTLSYVHNGLPMSTEGFYSNTTHNAPVWLITRPNVWNCAIWIDTTAINQNTTTFSLSCVIMHRESERACHNRKQYCISRNVDFVWVCLTAYACKDSQTNYTVMSSFNLGTPQLQPQPITLVSTY